MEIFQLLRFFILLIFLIACFSFLSSGNTQGYSDKYEIQKNTEAAVYNLLKTAEKIK